MFEVVHGVNKIWVGSLLGDQQVERGQLYVGERHGCLLNSTDVRRHQKTWMQQRSERRREGSSGKRAPVLHCTRARMADTRHEGTGSDRCSRTESADADSAARSPSMSAIRFAAQLAIWRSRASGSVAPPASEAA